MKSLLTVCFALLVSTLTFAQPIQGRTTPLSKTAPVDPHTGGPGAIRYYSDETWAMGQRSDYVLFKFVSIRKLSDTAYLVNLFIRCAPKDSMDVRILSKEVPDPYQFNSVMAPDQEVLRSMRTSKQDTLCSVIIKVKNNKGGYKELGIAISYRRMGFSDYFQFDPVRHKMILREQQGGGFSD